MGVKKEFKFDISYFKGYGSNKLYTSATFKAKVHENEAGGPVLDSNALILKYRQNSQPDWNPAAFVSALCSRPTVEYDSLEEVGQEEEE